MPSTYLGIYLRQEFDIDTSIFLIWLSIKDHRSNIIRLFSDTKAVCWEIWRRIICDFSAVVHCRSPILEFDVYHVT
jgi:hypothetical protein